MIGYHTKRGKAEEQESYCVAICEWEAKIEIERELVAVRNVRYQPDRLRGPKLVFEVWDTTGKHQAKMWTPLASVGERLVQVAFAEIPLIYIFGRLTVNDGYGQELTVQNIAFLGEGERPDMTRFQEPLPPDHPRKVAELDQLIATVQSHYLAELLTRTLGEKGILRDCYLTATAARSNHHAFPAGLLYHSLEVAHLGLSVLRCFPHLNRDLILTAALLHDVGKLWEMQNGFATGAYTSAGHLLGHIYLGAERLDHYCRYLKFPTDLREHLLHAVLSHHEELQYGSPVTPKTAEAITLAKADQISSELTQFYQAQQNWQTGADPLVRRGERTFWITPPEDNPVVADSDEPNLNHLPEPQAPSPDDPEERLMRRLVAAMDKPDAVPAGAFGAATLPILGTVAAFDGIRAGFAETSEPETRDVLVPPGGADFLLQVVGDSMMGAGILNGDLLMVRRQETAHVGQIVVALVPQVGPVVKRLTETGQGRFLSSESPDYLPIPVTDGIRLQGVVVRLQRDL